MPPANPCSKMIETRNLEMVNMSALGIPENLDTIVIN
jgi:hypothetical protein